MSVREAVQSVVRTALQVLARETVQILVREPAHVLVQSTEPVCLLVMARPTAERCVVAVTAFVTACRASAPDSAS